MKEEDILARHSRPQRYSTWVPKTRDWRYATGVFQHDDFENDPKDRSAWDTLDYDYQINETIKGKREGLSRSRSRSGSELGADDAILTMGTPDTVRSKAATESPQVVVARKARSPRKNKWASVARFKPSLPAKNDNAEHRYEPESLTIRLQFTGTNIAELQRITTASAYYPPTPQSLARTQSSGTSQTLRTLCSPGTPATSRTADTIHTPHILNSIESIHTFPRYQRLWVDETRDFNMKAVRLTIRKPAETVEELGAKYHWYTGAVPIDAIFPPGVPLSAKEINAYYPHHVRRKGVMLRLTNNGYRGPDIMGIQDFFRGPPTHAIAAPQMNVYQRDSVKSTIPTFKTIGYKGKSDNNLYTEGLALGKFLETTRQQFTVPSFDDLLSGLQHMPTGLDARGLTQCLAWYLKSRDLFTPRLELNVLHTQALIRALRQPLKPFGPQNLDRNALKEWRDNGSFEAVGVQEEPKPKHNLNEQEEQKRTKLHMDLDDDSVQLKLRLPIRHILTFPFLAINTVVGEALKMGIKKAEVRQAVREGQTGRRALDAKSATRRTEERHTEVQEEGVAAKEGSKAFNREQHTGMEEKKPYRIPKRPRPTEESQAQGSSVKKPRTTPAAKSHIPSRSPMPPRLYAGHTPHAYARQSFPHPGATRLSREGNMPAPSSPYVQPRQAVDPIYGPYEPA
ncbi:uncharacterized protein K460DRAFT_391061 [Cucurbitaria berberidis CBS 394.84]|uniref:Uncharacterized protein n=1 Tax=Cucurbitaria berberidis CBS 394.84 TaxID=1168544 RepID=A0A9P4GRU3_9PLEO|nr:uncharacterized protein K460DRAFT_391061 [Cucurbitaria berberidis CBS 394.84]KAF1850590.1 hypothetical protein K460DRAFT_391061 [Cucurbitaria berberidis CBS 394.84]